MPELIFPSLESIIHIAKLYKRHDPRVQMLFRNGMSMDLFVNYWLLNQFRNENGYKGESPHKIIQAAYACAKHYGRTPEQLIEAFVRVTSLEFYDADRRAEIKAMEAELLER